MGGLIYDSTTRLPPGMFYIRLGRAIVGDPEAPAGITWWLQPDRRVMQEIRRQVADIVPRRILRRENVRMVVEFQLLVQQ